MKRTIKLTKRDYLVLWYSWQCRFLAVRQLRRLFWEDASIEAARARLKDLCDAGYLGSETFPVGRDRTLYFSTRAGNRVLVDGGMKTAEIEFDFPRRPQEMTRTLDHDLRVIDIRIALEETGVIPISWHSDHELRKNRGQYAGPNTRVPDGIFEWEVSKVRYPGVLEYEHQRYNPDRWPDILRRLYYTYTDFTVFLVCRTAERVKSATAAVKRARVYSYEPEKFYVCDFDSVDAKGLRAGFVDLEGKPFTLVDPSRKKSEQNAESKLDQ